MSVDTYDKEIMVLMLLYILIPNLQGLTLPLALLPPTGIAAMALVLDSDIVCMIVEVKRS